MNRREIVGALLVLGAAPFPAIAQKAGKVRRVGFLGVGSASGYVNEVDAIRLRLRDLGYIEGKDILFEYRWADGNPERLTEMAVQLVALNVDVIITHSFPGTRAAAQATRTIPIVIADGPDPVAAGFVASLARPGGNITGSTAFQTELAVKRVQLMKEVLPRLRHLALLINVQNPNNELYARESEIAAKRLQVELHRFAIRNSEELAAAFAEMTKAKVEAAVISEDPLLNTNSGAIAALAIASQLPTCGFTSLAESGGLLGYSANRPLLYGRAADFVDKILKGAKAGDLPIERANKFDLVVNLKTAKALALGIPQAFLARADRVIQ